MIILAFDTCLNACSAAVGIERDGSVTCLAECYEPMPSGQAERLLPMIAEVLADAGVTLAEVGLIAVTNGPGTFTGTRIGIAAAKGLALERSIPVAALSSLQVIARQAALAASQVRDICVAVDVRRDEFYVQMFDASGRVARNGPVLMPLDQMQKLLRSQDVLLVGNGTALKVDREPLQPDDTGAMAQMLPRSRYALDLLSDCRHLTASALSPLYLRAPDAKPSSAAPLQRL